MKTTDVPANLREFIKVFNRVAGYRWDATQVFSDFVYYCIECITLLMRRCDDELSSQYNYKPPAAVAAFTKAKQFLERQLEKFDRPELIKPGTQLKLF